MVGFKMRSYRLTTALILTLLLGVGCVYYNTFYFARKNFNDAEDARKKAGIESAAGQAGKYQVAIEKSLKVLTDHPNSKYVDDALYIMGKSYYHLGDYSNGERKFRELLAAYPQSEYFENSLFYLGKCRVMQEEYILARQDFIKVDSLTNNQETKAEARYMLGEIEFREENYEEAIEYYFMYLDKFGDLENASVVQFKIAEAYSLLEDYEAAKDAYLKVANYNPHDTLYFQSQYNGGDSYYLIGQIDSGYVVFQSLAENDKYYSAAGAIRLKLSEGLAMQGDIGGALEEYQKIAEEFAKTQPAAVAYFEMGEIYMKEFNDLEAAKEMYDSSKSAYRSPEVYQKAIERSANISKLSDYRASVTGEDLEAAAQSQYNLAELIMFELGNPDTALYEFRILIDSFPQSSYAAKAHLARGYIFSSFFDDPEAARKEYEAVIEKYPHTDYVEDAAEELAIDLDSIDIDYPGKRYRTAEKMLFEEQNIDSAMIIFQSIIDDFPGSKFAPKAAYAKVRLMEIYSPPEEYIPDDSNFVPDSTLILAYQNVADTYAGTEYADSALSRLGKKVQRRPPPQPQQQPQQEDEGMIDEQFAQEADTVSGQVYSLDSLAEYFGVDSMKVFIDTLHEIKSEPRYKPEFVYPPSAYQTQFDGYVGFAVKIDGLGKPIEWHIVQPSTIREIDEAAYEALRYTEFNTAEMDLEYFDQWQYYRIRVEPPRDVSGYE